MKIVPIMAVAVVLLGGLLIAYTQKDTIMGFWTAAQQDTITVFVGGISFSVTVADSPEERRQGLSGTEPLPEFAGKLFIFDTDAPHAIWMKDMNYALDIMWFDKERNLIHIEENVTPETYTRSRTIFRPDRPARYVLEVSAGSVDALGITTSDTITLPPQFLTN